jgi:hypothetical protein
MPDVTCSSCGTNAHVRFRRGVRLAEIACPARPMLPAA